MGRPREIEDEAIFLATFRVLCRLSYTRLSLAAVAREVGVSAAALVKRFGSKRALLLAFAEQFLQMSRARFADSRATHASPLDALRARYLMRFEYVNDPISLANVLSFYIAMAADPQFTSLGVRRLRMQHGEIQRLLDEAVACGELLPCDTARLAAVLLAAVNGAGLLGQLDEARPAAEWLHDVFDVILDPLRRPAPIPTRAEV